MAVGPNDKATDIAIAQEFARIARLNDSGRRDEAWQAANDLYGTYPQHAIPNFIIALGLHQNGQKSDALQYAEAAVKLAPENASYLTFLGKLYIDLAIFEDALPALQKAFDMDKTLYRAPWALAEYYFTSGQGTRALPYFELALNAAPEVVRPDVTYMYAQALAGVGRMDDAEQRFKDVASMQKFELNVLANISHLKNNDHTSAYAQQILRALEDPAMRASDRSRLYLTLGRLYENGRDYDNAFHYFEKSKELLNRDFSTSEIDSILEQSRATFRPEIFEHFKTFGHSSEKPIFVVGMPRSGTTLTEQILASHSQVEGVGELDRMGKLATALSQPRGWPGMLDKMTEVGPSLWKDIPGQYLKLIDVLAPGVAHSVDKMPHNFTRIGFIHLCFPNAKIIHCRRNPLDTFISTFQNPFGSFHNYSFAPESYGEYYIRYLALMEHWTSVLPGVIHDLNYEDLTANPEVEIRRMLAFLGLPWEEACLKFNERESTVLTHSRLQVRQPINTGSVARWRRYEKHLGPLMAMLDGAGVPYR